MDGPRTMGRCTRRTPPICRLAVLCTASLLISGVAGAAQTTTTTTVPGAAGSTTTTTTPQHVVNQPNLNALTPHIEALAGPGVHSKLHHRTVVCRANHTGTERLHPQRDSNPCRHLERVVS